MEQWICHDGVCVVTVAPVTATTFFCKNNVANKSIGLNANPGRRQLRCEAMLDAKPPPMPIMSKHMHVCRLFTADWWHPTKKKVENWVSERTHARQWLSLTMVIAYIIMLLSDNHDARLVCVSYLWMIGAAASKGNSKSRFLYFCPCQNRNTRITAWRLIVVKVSVKCLHLTHTILWWSRALV